MATAYIKQLTDAIAIEAQTQREEKERAAAQAARERLTPLEDRLARLLATIPIEVRREGLSLMMLQAQLRARVQRGRSQGNGPAFLGGIVTPKYLRQHRRRQIRATSRENRKLFSGLPLRRDDDWTGDERLFLNAARLRSRG